MTTSNLPFGLKASDLKYPSRPRRYDWNKEHSWDVLHTIKLHRTERFGWVVTTLFIRNPSRRSRPGAQPRTYAISADGQVCRVGIGPHIKETITAYVTRGRLKALKELVDLHEKGLVEANEIRDRRSSRMAQGELYRMNLRRGWMDAP
jgi:hypothetical protein